MSTFAQSSPRFEKDILKWYEGDTFDVFFTIELTNSTTGENIEYSPEDKIIFTFYKEKSNDPLSRFIFSDIGSDNVVVLQMTDTETTRFKAGKYVYSIQYKNALENLSRTIGANCLVEVEKCH